MFVTNHQTEAKTKLSSYSEPGRWIYSDLAAAGNNVIAGNTDTATSFVATTTGIITFTLA